MSRPVMVNAYDPADAERVEPRTRHLIERREDVLGPGYRLFYREPLAVVRGEGSHLFDADGNDYLDVYNNVPSVGHSHPHVVAAVHEQMQRLNTNTRYVQESLVAYAERLVATFPQGTRPRDLRVHRFGGQRPRAASCPLLHRESGRDRHRGCLPRTDLGGGGILTVARHRVSAGLPRPDHQGARRAEGRWLTRRLHADRDPFRHRRSATPRLRTRGLLRRWHLLQ